MFPHISLGCVSYITYRALELFTVTCVYQPMSLKSSAQPKRFRTLVTFIRFQPTMYKHMFLYATWLCKIFPTHAALVVLFSSMLYHMTLRFVGARKFFPQSPHICGFSVFLCMAICLFKFEVSVKSLSQIVQGCKILSE